MEIEYVRAGNGGRRWDLRGTTVLPRHGWVDDRNMQLRQPTGDPTGRRDASIMLANQSTSAAAASTDTSSGSAINSSLCSRSWCLNFWIKASALSFMSTDGILSGLFRGPAAAFFSSRLYLLLRHRHFALQTWSSAGMDMSHSFSSW
ncbi:hypothetical protein V6N13_083976 [Hibiscus sabdariffa]|uniref:Uncharacterized protein n=1 Tax=Hibiscus sabdariffa TaxID=183260 RepID=A0ABR2SZY5_9ROSI